jgi:lipopolysaccharide transport system permease protein
MLYALWSYRGFVLGSVKREFQSRYRNSLLGGAWTILNPLAMVLVYTLVLSNVMRARLPGTDDPFAYSVYLCSGIFGWGLFSEITGRAQNVFLENANLIKKLSFPRLCLPTIVVLSAVINFSVIFGLFLVFLLVTGRLPGLPLFGLLPVLAFEVLFAIGLGITLGVLNTFFRDVGQFFGIALQFWFWFTPIVYPINIVPDPFRDLLALNPMVPVIGAYQTILVHGQWPDWRPLLFVGLLGLLLCAFAVRLFRKRSGEMIDEL